MKYYTYKLNGIQINQVILIVSVYKISQMESLSTSKLSINETNVEIQLFHQVREFKLKLNLLLSTILIYFIIIPIFFQKYFFHYFHSCFFMLSFQ